MWDANKDTQTNIDEYFENKSPYNCDFCPGLCNGSPRRMLWEKAPVVFMEAFNYPHNFAATINLQGTEYSLYAITYGNGDHFVGCVNVPSHGWHFYDGLELYHGYGPGLKKVLRPYAPTGYRKSHLCYVRVKPLP